MKVLVVGGDGRIGAHIVADLTRLGHRAVSASRRSGVDVLSGAGLSAAIAGVAVVVDVSAARSTTDEGVLEFFTVATGNLLAAERAAGVRHHVAVSIVGADRVPDSGYLRAKVNQERLIEASGQPHSIVRATQFFEFAVAIADSATEGSCVRLPHAAMQPIAGRDVSTAVTGVAVGEPLNGIVSIAGPQRFGVDDFVRAGLTACGDPREVITDARARYFGAVLDDEGIAPIAADRAIVYPTRFAQWAVSESDRS